MTFSPIANPILIDLPSHIVSPRLEITPPTIGMGAALSEAILESWDEMHKYAPWVTTPDHHTPELMEVMVRRHCARYIMRELFIMHVFVKDEHRYIGAAELFNPNWSIGSFEIGYWQRRSGTGKKYTQESLNALIRFAREFFNAQRIFAETMEDNAASRRILEKLGFVLEGILEKGVHDKSGNLLNKCVYAITDFSRLPDLNVQFKFDENK